MPVLPEIIYSIRWQDCLDVAILSIIIYQILLMLRGTRTIQILFGFLLVAIFFYFANVLNLVGSTWVLKNLLNSIVILFIVLFQSEIKNALAQMGTKTLFKDANRGTANVLEEIYSVCEHFSESKIGALIVLENEMGLANYYSGATQLDAEFSPHLLVSLFNTHVPLHDGAVIINKNSRIAYAGCILPLSKEIDFSKSWGTRHRAALGLSEESDAVVLVVSEETGEISMAYNGSLLTQTEKFSVKNGIREILLKENKKPSGIVKRDHS